MRMLKVFLADDETIIREMLRDNMPWEQEGFMVVGEAPDGELALPMIRKLRPDVLITDIKMPFMDGLALAKLAVKEFPDMKIVIISGYEEFDYARQAIAIGVTEYLLKPVTRAKLIEVLRELQGKIGSEREQQDYLEKFRREAQEYEQFARRKFFEQLVSGELSVQQVYEEAEKLGLDIHAPCYNIVLFSVQPVRSNSYSEPLEQAQGEVMQFFLRYPDYLLFRWNLQTCAVLVKGDTEKIHPLTERCLEVISQGYGKAGDGIGWHATAGVPVSRLSNLPETFLELQRIWAYRHIAPQLHILNAENTRIFLPSRQDEGLDTVDVSKVDPSVIRNALQSASFEEIPKFAEEYLGSVREGLHSRMFFQYLLLSIRFTAASFAQATGNAPEDFLKQIDQMAPPETGYTYDAMLEYLKDVLTETILLRDNASKTQNRSLVHKAVAYIDENFTSESLSLNEVSRAINVSANYFSAIFSQEMGSTFIEYVTRKRMELARQLLLTTDKRSGEIAFAVGYKDPHYFSFLFRKTQGCTPRDFRNGGKK